MGKVAAMTIGFSLFCRIALCLAVALVAAAPARANEPAPLSDRQHQDWTAIGRLNWAGGRNRGMCTATLIAPDLVLTAAHCLYKSTPDGSKLAQPGDLIFAAGWLRGKPVAHSAAAQTWVHPGYQQSQNHMMQIGYDLGLVRLQSPLDPALVTPLPVADAPTPDRPVALIGYRGDRPHMLSASFRCKLLGEDLRLLALDCPVVKGNSGGPILSQIDGVWNVVGVVSSMSNQTGRKQQLKSLAARPDRPFLNSVLNN